MLPYINWAKNPEDEEFDEEEYYGGPETIQTDRNHVYFYARVNQDSALALVRKLRELDVDLQMEKHIMKLTHDIDVDIPIMLHINSLGGDLVAGLNIRDAMRQLKTPITTIVEGTVASAATLISLSGDKRLMNESAYVLIHQLSAHFGGTAEQLKDEMDLVNVMMKDLVDFYSSKTKLKPEEVKALLKRDQWLSAKQCIKQGFVEESI